MRLIRKGPEPPLLLAFRKTPGARYESLPTDAKRELREALVRDQHGLCCFCMQRVEPEVAPELRVKVAHWLPQSVEGARDLDWTNLLAACPGNEGAPRERQHCDTRQGESILTVNPREATHVAGITYTTRGEVRSPRPELQADIEQRLNLNDEALCSRRREAVLGMVRGITHPGVALRQGDLRGALERCRTPDARGHLPVFAGALEWWLLRRGA